MHLSGFIAAQNASEYWTQERCYIRPLLNDVSSPEVSLALARVEPGVTTQLHRLECVVERYVVRKGQGLLQIDGQSQLLNVGDQAVIAANAAQCIKNTGDVDLEFYCVCTPRFEHSCYVNLEDEETRSIP